MLLAYDWPPVGRDPGLFRIRWFSAVDPTIPPRGTGLLLSTTQQTTTGVLFG